LEQSLIWFETLAGHTPDRRWYPWICRIRHFHAWADASIRHALVGRRPSAVGCAAATSGGAVQLRREFPPWARRVRDKLRGYQRSGRSHNKNRSRSDAFSGKPEIGRAHV